MTSRQSAVVAEPATTAMVDHTLRSVIAEIPDGLRHGYFESTLTSL